MNSGFYFKLNDSLLPGAIQIKGFYSVTQMGDHDAAAHNQPDIEGVVKLFIAPSGIDALDDVVIDAVVAAEHHRRDQSKQFLRLRIQRTVMIRIRVEIVKALNAKMVDLANPRIHFSTV